MTWSFPIGSVAGTVVRIHLTFLLLLAWIGAAALARGGHQEAVWTLAFMLLLFLCVLLHEFGHVLAARRYGVKTPDITLLPIGGMARMERIPEKPTEELVIALAGPLVNVAIAALLFGMLGSVPAPDTADAMPRTGHALLDQLAWVNVMLVVFNLIPAFPMDGGRVLRAFLAFRMGHAQATQVAAKIGQAVAFGLGLLGLLNGNALLVFIALFVYLGAAGEAQAVQMMDVGRDIRLADAMVTRFETLSPQASVQDAARLLVRTLQRQFPVVDGAGKMRGLLTHEAMVRALQENGGTESVLEAMRRDIPTLSPRSSLAEAITLLQRQEGTPAVAVTDAEGKLLGLITPETVGELMLLRATVPAPPARPRNPWA
jgi:stage IV sporulation protein FB